MDLNEFLAVYDQQQRIAATFPQVRRQVAGNVVRHIDQAENSQESWVIYSKLDETNAEQTIQREIAYFESIGHNFEWKLFSHDTPADLKDRLAAQGFEIGDVEAVLILDLEKTPPALLQPVRHDVRRITNPEQIGDVVAVQEAVWQQDQTHLAESLAESLWQEPDRLSVYVAYVDNKPVGAAWISFDLNSQFAGLWGGSTVETYRKRGIYTALVATRTQEAIKRRKRFLTIDASPMSRPILEKFGFELLTYTYPCKWRIEK